MIVPAYRDGMEASLPMELETEQQATQQPEPENPMSTAAPPLFNGELPHTQPEPDIESASHGTASQSLADINAKVVQAVRCLGLTALST